MARDVRHKREHDVVRRVAAAHDGVAQDARAAVLVVGGDVLLLSDACDGVQDAPRARVLHEAALARDDPMGPTGIKTASDPPAPRVCEGSRRLVAKRHGLALDAHDLAQLAAVLLDVGPEQALDELLLAAQLDGVGDAQPLATAAVSCDRACVCAVSHEASPSKLLSSSIHERKGAIAAGSGMYRSFTGLLCKSFDPSSKTSLSDLKILA